MEKWLKHSNLDELKKSKQEGTDFRIISRDREHNVTIVSPHGGRIEAHTSEIAVVLADKKYNLFDFQGIQQKDNFHELHIMSTNFMDSNLNKMLEHSNICISVHGCKSSNSKEKEVIFIGGKNREVVRKLTKELQEFFTIGDSSKFPAKGENNFVNAVDIGVQLELSSGLRKSLLSDKEKLNTFKKCIDKFINKNID